MPHEGYADPVTNDRPGFHSNVSGKKHPEPVTRAIKASGVSSIPLVMETADRVMQEIMRPTSTDH